LLSWVLPLPEMGQIFCTVGEVTGTHVVTVKFPEEPFDDASFG